MFTESEQRFLRQEHATAGLREMVDLRRLGCPERIVTCILEQRASKLGRTFAEFRRQPATVLDLNAADLI